jgi:hypothetical protein
MVANKHRFRSYLLVKGQRVKRLAHYISRTADRLYLHLVEYKPPYTAVLYCPHMDYENILDS